MKGCRLAVLIPLLFIQVACAAITRQTGPPPGRAAASGEDAATLLARCEAMNRGLTTTRGIGRITVTLAGKSQHLRIAWTSVVPEKLRAVFLGVDGRPLLTASVDGTWVYLLDHTSGEFRKESPRGHRLLSALQLPLDVQSLALLLAGRMPALDYDRVELPVDRTPATNGIVLKKWWNRVGRVYLHDSQSTFTRIEAYRQTGEMRYRADIEATRNVKEFRVPRVLSIQDGTARRLTFNIERYWANEPVSPETFRLEPPD